MCMMIKLIFRLVSLKTKASANGMNHKERGERVRIGGCRMILTNF